MRRFISLGALSAFGVIGVLAQDPGCLETCVTGTSGKFTEFGCVDAVQEGCLCPNQDFQFSVRDCSIQSCQANEGQAFDYLFNPESGFCKSHARPESSAAPSTTEAPATTEAASTTEAPATTEEPAATTETTGEATTTGEPVSTTETPAPTTSAPETTNAVESSTTVESGITTSTSEPSSTEDSGASTTSESEGSDEDGEDDESGGGGGGLSSGAAVGIGVGVAVAFIAGAIILAVFLLRRRRNQQPKDQSVDISRPMPPAAGRAYSSAERGSFGEKGRGGESIEMQTNRYEDMPPRQTPRIMV